MNRRIRFGLGVWLLLAAGSVVSAEPPDWSTKPPSMGISFSPDIDQWSQRCGSVSGGFEVISVYLMAPYITDLHGWEASLRVPDASTGWVVTSYLVEPENINLLQPPGFIVGFVDGFNGSPHFTLVRFDMVYTAGDVVGTNDVLLCVADAHAESGGTRPSMVLGQAIYPAEDLWCDVGGLGSDCAILNPVNLSCPSGCPGVPIQTRSFSAIKAQF